MTFPGDRYKKKLTEGFDVCDHFFVSVHMAPFLRSVNGRPLAHWRKCILARSFGFNLVAFFVGRHVI
jgi:hypothetical protein